MKKNLSFSLIAFASAIIAVGCANPLAGAKDGSTSGGETASSRAPQQYSPLPCNGVNQGYDLYGVDPQQLTNSFRLELVFSVAASQPNAYANILDVNHRANVGMVVQQDGTTANRFVFGVGDGSRSYCIPYSFKPGLFYACVFQMDSSRNLRLYVCETATLESCDVMRAGNLAGNIPMAALPYFLPGSVPTLGYNRNYGRYFNGTIYRAKFYQCSGSANHASFDGTPRHSGDPVMRGDPASKLGGDFVIEAGVRVEAAQGDYATILDINHRSNIGLVIQQNGSARNNYCFGIGYGSGAATISHDLKGAYYSTIQFRRDSSYISLAVNGEIVRQIDSGYSGKASFLPGSAGTIGYNANYGRYFNGIVNDVMVWTPVPPTN